MIKAYEDSLASACNTFAAVGKKMNDLSLELDNILRRMHSDLPDEAVEYSVRKAKNTTSDISTLSLRMSVALETVIGRYLKAENAVEMFGDRNAAMTRPFENAVSVVDVAGAVRLLDGITIKHEGR